MKKEFENKKYNKRIKTFMKIINDAYIHIQKCHNNRIENKF